MKLSIKERVFRIYDKYTKNITFCREAYDTTKLYNNRQMRKYQLGKINDSFGIKTWKEFNKKKLTTKQDLRKFKPDLSGYDKEDLTFHYSSGSTGEPLKTYGPIYLQSIKASIFERAWKSVGWDGKRWILRLTNGNPQWKVFDYLRNVKPVNYRKVNRLTLCWMECNKPFLIHGEAGALRELTTLLIKAGKEDVMKDISLYLMSEDTKIHKPYLEKYYKAVYCGYGLAELCTVASQCRYGNYHVNMETCICESINNEIVVTDLNNNITPILRYRTKDTGKIRKSDCLCGSKHDILYDLEGRGIDYYDGPGVKAPLNWKILSPISHRPDLFLSWKVKVSIKKKLLSLYVIWKDKPSNLNWYSNWLKEQTGLDFEVITRKRMTNKQRMKLLEIVK